MSENEIVEVARATTEVAKTTAIAIETGRGLGSFFEQVFGELIINSVGLVSDTVWAYRENRLVDLKVKIDEKHSEAGIINTRPVPLAVALPILEYAGLEEEEKLHSMWANLLATAMNPNKPQVKRSFSGILSQLEAMDVALFAKMVSFPKESKFVEDRTRTRESWCTATLIDESDFEVSFDNLVNVGLVRSNVRVTSLRLSPESPRGIQEYGDKFAVSALGLAFHEAVS